MSRDLAAELREARDRYGVDSPQARAAFAARLAEVRSAEADLPETWWWLSFADANDGHNLGCCVVRGRSVSSAAEAAYAGGYNPGGEVLGASVGDITDAEWVAAWTGRLLTPDEARTLPPPTVEA